jgi:hypothetical protein
MKRNQTSNQAIRQNARVVALLHDRKFVYIYKNDISGEIIITLTKRKATWLTQEPVTLLEKLTT